MKHRNIEDSWAELIMEHYGGDLQRIKAIEELNECGARLAKDHVEKHIAPSSSTYDMTVEEIADATIMLLQMRFYYGHEAVDAAVMRKLSRTLKRAGIDREESI